MASIQVLNRHHYTFACEVINGLNTFYNIPVELFQHNPEDRFFNNDVRWAVATISYVFRKDFLKVFTMLRKGLESRKMFKEYCMIISVKRNNRYYFNFLKRVSLIYEMTIYCFKKGNDYFLEARNCIAQYQDIEYFHSVGSWTRLYETAAFLRELGRPFLLVILEESTLRRPLSFQATVERIEKRLKKQNNAVILNSEETSFLLKQKEKFIARKRDSNSSKDEKAFIERPKSDFCMSNTAPEDGISIMDEKRAIMDYFRSLLPPKYFNELQKNERASCSPISKPFEFEKTCTATESSVSREATQSVSSLNKRLTEHFGSDQEQLEEVHGKHGSILTLPDKSNEDGNKLEEDLFLSGSSSDDENSQQCNNSAAKDNHSLLVECGLYSSNESITPESSSSRKEITFTDNKTSNSKLLEEDLFRPAVGSPQQGNITNATVKHNSPLSVKCGLYSSDESPSSTKKFNSPDDKTGNSELLEDDLILSEASFEDENAQKPLMKNESSESKKSLLVEYDSSSEPDSSESQSQTKYANKVDRLNLITDDFYNRALFRRPDIFTSENVTAQQSTSKEDKHCENKTDFHSSRDTTFVRRTIEKAESVLRFRIHTTLSVVAASVSDLVDLDSSREAYYENSQAVPEKSMKPVSDTETAVGDKNSDYDPSADVKDSNINSQQQQRKKRKNRRKKKGKRK